MDKILHQRIGDIEPKHKSEHSGFEYQKRTFVPRRPGGRCVVAVYEIPPGKSAYPYHYHTSSEEAFYILRGGGILTTPQGERRVSSGELLFFPANEEGAHRLTNDSASETLAYIDFDTCGDIDVAFYPDSGKMGVWGKGINQVYRLRDKTGYYEDE